MMLHQHGGFWLTLAIGLTVATTVSSQTDIREWNRRFDAAPIVVPADRMMRVVQHSNVRVRNCPGTQYDKIGLLKAGQKVQVTGESGEWLKIVLPGGGKGFVHGSLLTEVPSTPLKPVDLGPNYPIFCDQ